MHQVQANYEKSNNWKSTETKIDRNKHDKSNEIDKKMFGSRFGRRIRLTKEDGMTAESLTNFSTNTISVGDILY